MKKLFGSLGIVIIFMVGCDIQPRNIGFNGTPVPIGSPYPEVFTPTPSTTTNEKDITDGQGHVISSGEGRSIFIRHNPPKKRQVVHQVKKGFWVGGEK